MSFLYKLFKLTGRITVSLAVGLLSSIILLITTSILFAGPNAGEWFRLFFFDSEPPYIIWAMLVIASFVFPFTKNLNIILHDKKGELK